MHLAKVHRPAVATADVVAERDSTQDVGAAQSVALTDRQRCWHDCCTGMGSGRGVYVVSLVGVGEYAVRQRRRPGGRHNVADDDARVGASTFSSGVLDRSLTRWQLRTRDHRRHRVDEVDLRGLYDVVGKWLAYRASDVLAEIAHGRRDGCVRRVHRRLLVGMLRRSRLCRWQWALSRGAYTELGSACRE